MSIFSSIILPYLERELIELQPEIADFVLDQLKKNAHAIIDWLEVKANIDLNGDGVVGGE